MPHLLLDTNLLGQLCHPNPQQYQPLKQWAYDILQPNAKEYQLCLPEIADYELRRKLIHMALQQGKSVIKSLTRLNDYHEILKYVPLQTSTIHLAAQLWAEARLRGTLIVHLVSWTQLCQVLF